MVHSRRKSRITALQVLFETDSSGHDPVSSLHWLAQEEMLPASVISYAQELITGVNDNKEQIDMLITNNAPNWPIEQISIIDRNILRLAIFEIIINNKVPLKAAINEAIELAKEYGSENSGKFVNGVLGAALLKLDGEKKGNKEKEGKKKKGKQ